MNSLLCCISQAKNDIIEDMWLQQLIMKIIKQEARYAVKMDRSEPIMI